MKLILKGLLGLIFIYYLLITSLILAYAEVPDVSKWSCPNAVVNNSPDYDVEVTFCDIEKMKSGAGNSTYIRVSGELVYIHEHRTDADKAVYYNALKTNEGSWVEVVNKSDLFWKGKLIKNAGVEVSIVDDNDNIVAKRFIPLLKK